ncbi:MAG: tripartite tricarboxylate transporter permease [Candidatus Thermoplasmatota archaeon]|nr:tripartite tricarboxylate transporter permease [Candidatus Thermoplasmatota archaeon]
MPFAAIGIFFGVVAGLLPGLHPNNVALMLSSLAPSIILALSSFTGMTQGAAAEMVCAAIVSCAVSNVFFSYLPSTFIGAPDPETALSILPGHSMLMKGDGYKAVSLAAIGCIGGVVFAILAVAPFRFIIGSPINLGPAIKSATPYILIAISILLILSEYGKGAKRVAAAAAVFALAGIFGIFTLEISVSSPFGLATTPLFPIFTGLFGISTMLGSSQDAKIPEQKTDEINVDAKIAAKSIATGSIAGAFVGFLPGLGPSQATIVANFGQKKFNAESAMVSLAAVCSADSIFALATLFMTGSARSGAMTAVAEIIPVEQWDGILPPNSMIILAMSALLSATASYFLVRISAKKFAMVFSKLPYQKMSRCIVIFLIALVWIFSGWLGLFILAVSTAIGMIPPMLGIKRSHLMAVLIVPIIIRLIF